MRKIAVDGAWSYPDITPEHEAEMWNPEEDGNLATRAMYTGLVKDAQKAVQDAADIYAPGSTAIVAGGMGRALFFGMYPNDLDVFVSTYDWENKNPDMPVEDLEFLIVKAAVDSLIAQGRAPHGCGWNEQEPPNGYDDVSEERTTFSVYNIWADDLTIQVVFRRSKEDCTPDGLMATFHNSLAKNYWDPAEEVWVYSDDFVNSIEKKTINHYSASENSINKTKYLLDNLHYTDNTWKVNWLQQKDTTGTENPAQNAIPPTPSKLTLELDGTNVFHVGGSGLRRTARTLDMNVRIVDELPNIAWQTI